ncbi:MAG: DeoR family transcriptional regulator, partial [Rhodobacteraceae bacterium]|nr:DeoR family transcriptional regulator [Paracoccaceae bacterium]
MVNNLRSPEIIKLANQQSIVRVEELAEYFNVSLQTIRKDLNKLCSDGQLERVHGGAIIPSHIENIEYEQRKKINLLGKQAIGRECAKKIPNEICLFMGIGTSTETAAKLLLEHKNLLIVTNNLNIANVLKNNTKSEVV